MVLHVRVLKRSLVFMIYLATNLCHFSSHIITMLPNFHPTLLYDICLMMGVLIALKIIYWTWQ